MATLGKWATVSNNADRLHDEEAIIIQQNSGNKSLTGMSSRENENRQMIWQIH